MTSSVSVRHNFETAHRLPHLSGKCENLHGHSWWVEVTIEAPHDTAIVVEFGSFKATLREWIDRELDHGAMLGADDPLVPILRGLDSKLLTFGADSFTAPDLRAPTVENVARLIGRVATAKLGQVPHAPDARVVRVEVTETHVNKAVWTPSD